MSEFLDDRRRALEDSFFRKRNDELLDKLRKQIILEAKRHELAIVSGIRDQHVLDRFIRLDFKPQTVAALALVPMIRVAWADGKLEDHERDAITKAAVEAGLEPTNPSYHWLITWLESPPDDELVTAWTEYVQALRATLNQDDCEELCHGLIDRAREVAESAGSLLGLTNPISKKEQSLLDDMKAAFSA